jgi:hypothetical protein
MGRCFSLYLLWVKKESRQIECGGLNEVDVLPASQRKVNQRFTCASELCSLCAKCELAQRWGMTLEERTIRGFIRIVQLRNKRFLNLVSKGCSMVLIAKNGVDFYVNFFKLHQALLDAEIKKMQPNPQTYIIRSIPQVAAKAELLKKNVDEVLLKSLSS